MLKCPKLKNRCPILIAHPKPSHPRILTISELKEIYKQVKRKRQFEREQEDREQEILHSLYERIFCDLDTDSTMESGSEC